MRGFTNTQIRNFLSFRSIKSKLIGAFSLFSLLVFIIILGFFWVIYRQNQLDKISIQLQNISHQFSKLQQQEKNFFLFDQNNIDFFTTGNSKHLNLHKKYMHGIKDELKDLRSNTTLSSSSIKKDLSRALNKFEAYDFIFDRLVSLVRHRGFQKLGLLGEIDDFVNKIDQNNLINTQPEWISLRRAEKDFHLRKEEQYIQQFKQMNDSLLYKIDSQENKTNEQKEASRLLKLYRVKFLRLVESHKEIGTTSNQGVTGQLAKLSQEVAQVVNTVNQKITTQTHSFILSLRLTLAFVLLLFITINIILGYYVIHKMGKPINNLSESIHQVIENDFEDSIQIYQSQSKDEVGGISRDVAWMVNCVRQRSQEILRQKEQIDQAYQNVKLLSDIGRDITAQLNVPDIVKVVSNQVGNLMDSDLFSIGLYNQEKKRLDILSEQPHIQKLIATKELLEDETSLAAYCFKNSCPILINDFMEEAPQYLSEIPENQERPISQSLIYVPLISLDECIGVVTVQSNRKNAYQPYHMDILQNMGNNISVALENADIYQKLHQKNKRIVDSISYAQRIQEAMLPSLKSIQEVLPESFVFFKPRDIVSGDFYWFTQLEPKPIYEEVMADAEGIRSEFKGFQSPKTFIAAIDCTGHGVPGAFMSMIGNDLLDSIVIEQNITRPDEVLNRMHQGIRTVMKQKKNENSDGMDIALCVIDFENSYLEYSGSFNPIVVIQDGEMQVIKADKKLVGVWYREDEEKRTYTRHRISLDKPTTIYIHSDGFADQLGGSKKKKFLSKRLHRLLYEIHRRPMFEQKLILDNRLREWIGDGAQTDDVLLIGFHLEPPNYYDDFSELELDLKRNRR